MLKVVQKLHRVLPVLVGVFSVSLVILMGSVATAADNASIDTTVNIKPSLTLNIPASDITMNLDPSTHDFDEQDLTVKVGTNNKQGFKLYVNTENNATDLVNVADSSKTIENLTATTSASSFPANNWGYRLTQDSTTSSGNYGTFTPGSIVTQSNVPINEKVATMGFGAKIDYLKPSGLYQLNLDFKVVPTVTQEYMQNLDPEYCTDEPSIVTDARDDQTYAIARLADGNCWMVQNLRIGQTTNSVTLSATDTDITSGSFTLDGESSAGADFTTANANTSVYYCTEYGCYYNWYTATVGNGMSSIASGSVRDSICPAGWSLPTGGPGGQIEALANSYGGTGQAAATAMLVDPNSASENINGESLPGFVLGGRYVDSLGPNANEYGQIWSRTAAAQSYAYTLWIFPNKVDVTANNVVKRGGRQVRCILNEPIGNVTTMQQVGTMTASEKTDLKNSMVQNKDYTLMDTRDNHLYTVRKLGDGNIWMVDNLSIGCEGSYRRGGNLVLSNANSNVQNNWTLSTTTTKSLASADGECTAGASGTCTTFDNPRMKCDAGNGAWYNYAAASAGTITGSTNSSDASYDICPKGWGLPSNTQFSGILSYASSFNLSLAGFYRQGSLNTISSDWWSLKAYGDTARYILLHNASTTELRTDLSRTDGFFVRCILR